MSTASGSAAGDPPGATATAFEHHWFKEPTEPAPRKYVVWLLIAQLFFFIALLGPAVIGVGLKIQDLVHHGALDKDGATAAAGVLGGVGALFATVANVVFGKVSDRTTSRWGRRRIWIVLGTLIMTAAFVIMALAPNLFTATVGWAIAQFGANMTLAPFIATMADHVPKFQRGKVGAALMMAQQIGVLGGSYVAQWFQDQMLIMFVAPSILAIGAMLVFAIVLDDQVLPQRPPRLSLREMAQTFWVSPVQHPDYALVWWSRFLITFAAFGFSAFRFFYLLNHVKVPEKEIPAVISTSVLIYTIALVIVSYVCGYLSDRAGQRKVFVWIATALYAIGTVGLIFVRDVSTFFILEGLMGVAYGMYLGVDMALVLDVLPNPDDSGKDLGVFNIANALPQTFAPMIGAIMVYVGDPTGNNYQLWFTICGVVCLIGAAVIFPIKSVK